MKPPRSQAKWYGRHSDQNSDTSETVSWSTDSSRLHRSYLRIARQAGIASNPPQSHPISQETLRKWEKTARESSIICNQAAGFNRLVKVQQDIQYQFKAIRLEHKGKSAAKLSAATEELQFLMDFNSSVCQAMAKSMEHLTDFVFVNGQRDISVILESRNQGGCSGCSQALRLPYTSPPCFQTMIKQAKEYITRFDKGWSGSGYKKGRYYPYERPESKPDNRKQDRLGRISHVATTEGVKGDSSRLAKGQQSYK